jgi:hypothetical protein
LFPSAAAPKTLGSPNIEVRLSGDVSSRTGFFVSLTTNELASKVEIKFEIIIYENHLNRKQISFL